MVQRLVDSDHVEQITVYADMKVIGNTCKVRRRGEDSGDSDEGGLSEEDQRSVRPSICRLTSVIAISTLPLLNFALISQDIGEVGSGDLTERERMVPYWMQKLESQWSNGEGGLTFVPSKKGLSGQPYRLSTAQVSRWIDFLVRACSYPF